MSELGSAISADLARYLRESQSRGAKVGALIQQYGLQATIVYRIGRWLKHRSRQPWWWPLVIPGWLFYLPAAWFMRAGYGVHLDLSADIGPGLYVGHFGNILVANCVMGPGCNVGEQTRVGSLEEKNGPRIGARVWLGGHSVVSGNVQIGDGATIGAGARVGNDVPPRALIMGNPSRVISRDYDNSAIL